jgi:hypothetical protein
MPLIEMYVKQKSLFACSHGKLPMKRFSQDTAPGASPIPT